MGFAFCRKSCGCSTHKTVKLPLVACCRLHPTLGSADPIVLVKLVFNLTQQIVRLDNVYWRERSLDDERLQLRQLRFIPLQPLDDGLDVHIVVTKSAGRRSSETTASLREVPAGVGFD